MANPRASGAMETAGTHGSRPDGVNGREDGTDCARYLSRGSVPKLAAGAFDRTKTVVGE
jgi:hypothetical protein